VDHESREELRRGLARNHPLFGVRVRTPRLTIQLPTDPDLLDVIEVIDAGIHDPSWMPFRVGWTDAPPARRNVESLAHWWRLRASWTPQDWAFCGAVWVDGTLVGVQDLMASDFGVLREVTTGSWLGQRFQGIGIGTEMRAAMLHLAFEGLGAVRAHSGYLEGNEPSRRVSEALGYVFNGYGHVEVRGRVVREVRVVLERSAWEERRRDDIEIEGLAACLELFGAQGPRPPTGH
jgi:RimJ/RimL family protein N-acetyltransferase